MLVYAVCTSAPAPDTTRNCHIPIRSREQQRRNALYILQINLLSISRFIGTRKTEAA